MGCRLWGRTESDTTEVTWQQQQCPYSLKGRRVKRRRRQVGAWEADGVRTWREESGSEAEDAWP